MTCSSDNAGTVQSSYMCNMISCSQQDEVEKLRQQGASEHDQEELIEQHEKALQNILNRMAADKIRMQSTLEEKLRKRREDKLRIKQNELVNNAEDAKRELEHQQQSQLQRMKADEVNSLLIFDWLKANENEVKVGLFLIR